MVDFEELAQAMGDLDEDTVVESLNEVMADGGKDAQKAMEACGILLQGILRRHGDDAVWLHVPAVQ